MLPARLSSELGALEPLPRRARPTSIRLIGHGPPCGNDGSHIAGFSGYTALKESKPMKPGLRPGASRVNRITIGPERTISFMGEDARTYATPAMIRDIEYTCRDLIMEHTDPGEDSVGMEVAIKHLAPTLLGMTVEIAVRVLAAVHRKHAHRDLDRHAQQRRREMLDGDFHPHGILAGIGVFHDEVAAGVLDIADHRGRGVGARVLAHEADGALRADGDAVDPGGARAKAWLHGFALLQGGIAGKSSDVRAVIAAWRAMADEPD